jgi:uncharacterized membrane protein
MFEQPTNEWVVVATEMLVTPLPIVSDVNELQLPNAYAPIVRIVFGSVYAALDCFM